MFLFLLFFLLQNTLSFGNIEKDLEKFSEKYDFHINQDSILGHVILIKDEFKVLFMIHSNIAVTNQNDFFQFEEPFFKKDNFIILPNSFTKKILNAYSNYIRNFKKSEITKGERKDNQINFIIIDPGHGEKDPGNINNNLVEKDLNLVIALKLEKILKNEFSSHIEIILTRSADIFLPLEERTAIATKMANDNKKGIYLSIHGNSSPNLEAKGIETYFFSSSPNIDQSFRSKGFVDNIKKFSVKKDLENILVKLEDLKISKESFFLAKNVHEILFENLKNFTLDRGVKEHKYFVIRNLNLASILVEIGFLSNEEEANNLKREDYQNKIVDGIYQGIKQFILTFNQNNGFLKLH